MTLFGLDAQSMAGQLVGLGGSFVSALGPMTSFKDSILGNESLSKMEKFQGAASGIAAGIGGIASATSSGGAGASAAKGALAGAGAGAQVGGPIGAAVGAAVGGIVGFFRGRGRDKVRKAIKDTIGVDVSEDLAMAIKDAAKEAGNTLETQTLLSLGDIFRDTGVDEFENGAQGAADAVTKLMKGVADGSIDAKEGIASIGDAFSELVNQTFEAGKVADAGLIQLVKNSRELGQEVPEIAAFVEQQLADAAQGISKVIGGIQIVDKQSAQDQATIFAGAFFATLEEQGLLAAVDAFQPAFEELKKSIADAGIEGVNFGGVERLFEIAGKEEFRPLLEGVQGLNEALVGMANSGYLTADSFSAFQRQGQAAFDQLTAAGLTQEESLQQIAPFLQSAIDAAERFGIPLDENTQKLIDQAEAAGIAFETDPMNRMADAMVLVAELLGATEEQLAGLGETAASTGEQIDGAFGGGEESPTAGLNEGLDKANEQIAGIGDGITQLPDVANDAVGGIQEAFATGSEGIVEGLDPISEKMTDEIKAAGEETSTAIDATFKDTNEAIKQGLSEVSNTFVSEVAPAAEAAAAATDKIAQSARAAAEAARDIDFPDGPGGGDTPMQAAAGFRGVLGKDTLIQAHRGEFVNIMSPAQTRAMDFAHAQDGMGPNSVEGGSITVEGDDVQITFVASGNKQQDDSTLDKLLTELEKRDGAKRRELQRMLGVRP
jgi:hypothetical protein